MGERAKSIGEEAENKVLNFIDSLGYNILETNNEEYDIDCIAESPPIKPHYGLALPRYAPNGLTAFEVKEPNITKKKIEKLRKKILKYNRENPDEKIKGGIYLVDRRITASMLDFMIRKKIWGWGVRRQRLYIEKVRTFNFWKEQEAFISEVPINKTCSYLRCSTPPPTDRDQLLHISVFFDEPFRKLSPKWLKIAMDRIKKVSIIPLLTIGIRPINIFFEYYSIGGLSKHLREEAYKSIVVPWNDEGISVIISTTPFKDYRAFTTL